MLCGLWSRPLVVSGSCYASPDSRRPATSERDGCAVTRRDDEGPPQADIPETFPGKSALYRTTTARDTVPVKEEAKETVQSSVVVNEPPPACPYPYISPPPIFVQQQLVLYLFRGPATRNIHYSLIRLPPFEKDTQKKVMVVNTFVIHPC
ncbi:hypothetical protein MIND_00002700 [Mycena indigotica]|uniref:Uncharacterized protein n=1 Tax=Mycena indigotica TaxID=2126181 RepID=A0A8H6WJT9_9AGAR|nr:uncharacterized protein MIND_00002700 [Mycena indigotica]KAF7314889.1 hypothetical protein MIND_00002700 [Mycena indigotica]